MEFASALATQPIHTPARSNFIKYAVTKSNLPAELIDKESSDFVQEFLKEKQEVKVKYAKFVLLPEHLPPEKIPTDFPTPSVIIRHTDSGTLPAMQNMFLRFQPQNDVALHCWNGPGQKNPAPGHSSFKSSKFPYKSYFTGLRLVAAVVIFRYIGKPADATGYTVYGLTYTGSNLQCLQSPSESTILEGSFSGSGNISDGLRLIFFPKDSNDLCFQELANNQPPNHRYLTWQFAFLNNNIQTGGIKYEIIRWFEGLPEPLYGDLLVAKSDNVVRDSSQGILSGLYSMMQENKSLIGGIAGTAARLLPGISSISNFVDFAKMPLLVSQLASSGFAYPTAGYR